MNTDDVYLQLHITQILNHIIPDKFVTLCLNLISINQSTSALRRRQQVCQHASDMFHHFSYTFDLTPRDRRIVMTAALLNGMTDPDPLKEGGFVNNLIQHHCPHVFSEKEINRITHCVVTTQKQGRVKCRSILSDIVQVAEHGMPSLTYEVHTELGTLKHPIPLDSQHNNLAYHLQQRLLARYDIHSAFWKTYPDIGKAVFKIEWETLLSELSQLDNIVQAIKTYDKTPKG